MNREEILKELKNLAEKFSFKFNEDWFSYTLLSPEELIILQFLVGCPKPDYMKISSNDRFENIEEFLRSKIYKRDVENCKNEGGGSVLEKKYFERFEKEIEKISNRKLKTKVKSIFNKINEEFYSDFLAVMCKGKAFDKILKHEWIHVLLKKNDIYFQERKKKWEWDEGLVTYLQYFISNKFDKLEKRLEKSENKFYKKYAKYALKWNEILQNYKEPEERLLKIKEKLRK